MIPQYAYNYCYRLTTLIDAFETLKFKDPRKTAYVSLELKEKVIHAALWPVSRVMYKRT